jgi:hypothetical protein
MLVLLRPEVNRKPSEGKEIVSAPLLKSIYSVFVTMFMMAPQIASRVVQNGSQLG